MATMDYSISLDAEYFACGVIDHVFTRSTDINTGVFLPFVSVDLAIEPI